MVEEAAGEVRLIASPEAGGGRATSPEVVWAQCASDGLARGLHDGPLDSRVAEWSAAFPDPQPAGEDVRRRSGVVFLADDELASTEKDRTGQGKVDRDRLVEVARHGPLVRRPGLGIVAAEHDPPTIADALEARAEMQAGEG